EDAQPVTQRQQRLNPTRSIGHSCSTRGSTQDNLHMSIWNDTIQLYNAPSTFQRCMISIFSDLLEDCMEVFMDDFTVYVESFEACLHNLSRVLHRCIDNNLVLNFEKYHFMVTKGIVLGNLVSTRGIEVDKAKIDVISSLPNPASMREVRSFLGHVDFSKITLPLSKLLQKDVDFNFDQPCVDAFQELKRRLTSVPILQALNWELQFEFMCDASNSVLEAVLGQRVSKQPHVIAYASRMMDVAQVNYTATEKELLTSLVPLEEAGRKAETDLMDAASPRVRRRDQGQERCRECYSGSLEPMTHVTPWYADICNYLIASTYPKGAPKAIKGRLASNAKYYIWDDPYL
ncbi:Retrovirus-related Pol polyprotein from transposon 17.6, partial [Mucuna pruriens]